MRYLFTLPDVKVFMSTHVNQDPLENFFGQQRQRGGTSDNPNAKTFVHSTQALRVVNTVCANVRGNCRGNKEVDMDIDNAPLRKRKKN